MLFEDGGFEVHAIKLSQRIEAQFPLEVQPTISEGINEGKDRLDRAVYLQDKGDELRNKHGAFAVATLAIQSIKERRGSDAVGEKKRVFIIDSLKHEQEVELLRTVYDQSFRMVGVHCERQIRENRLIGGRLSVAKYKGADATRVRSFMDRDEKDGGRRYGQHVRDAFYLSDFFIDNNGDGQAGANLTPDLKRFVDLLSGVELVRPTLDERAMYLAHGAARQSACLSRQVGAVLVSKDGEIVATGTNEVPRYNGGVYSEGAKDDCRCKSWQFTDGTLTFVGCHNDRKKIELRKQIGSWLAQSLGEELAKAAHPIPPTGSDVALGARQKAAKDIGSLLTSDKVDLSGMPGIRDLIEYSRAVHAEMGAVLSAARSGVSPVGSTLYCTTYPCHNCARHLVTTGVHKVLYVEPYVKSLASELHSDSISSELPVAGAEAQKMVVVPFTGVGPRMYDDYFATSVDLKAADGSFRMPKGTEPLAGVRLRELIKVEDAAASLIPDPR